MTDDAYEPRGGPPKRPYPGGRWFQVGPDRWVADDDTEEKVAVYEANKRRAIAAGSLNAGPNDTVN